MGRELPPAQSPVAGAPLEQRAGDRRPRPDAPVGPRRAARDRRAHTPAAHLAARGALVPRSRPGDDPGPRGERHPQQPPDPRGAGAVRPRSRHALAARGPALVPARPEAPARGGAGAMDRRRGLRPAVPQLPPLGLARDAVGPRAGPGPRRQRARGCRPAADPGQPRPVHGPRGPGHRAPAELGGQRRRPHRRVDRVRARGLPPAAQRPGARRGPAPALPPGAVGRGAAVAARSRRPGRRPVAGSTHRARGPSLLAAGAVDRPAVSLPFRRLPGGHDPLALRSAGRPAARGSVRRRGQPGAGRGLVQLQQASRGPQLVPRHPQP